jgi:hypothetical protein
MITIAKYTIITIARYTTITIARYTYYIRGGQPGARGPFLARQDFLNGPAKIFSKCSKKIMDLQRYFHYKNDGVFEHMYSRQQAFI